LSRYIYVLELDSMPRTLTLACICLLLVAAIVYRPDEAFQASLQGLTVWWTIVFPGLLPFLALLELMLAFGAVHALGVLLDPLMRRLFRLPGEAGFAVALGWTGGFPSGAEAAAALRRRGAVSRGEGQRLLALSHMPSPLFMLLVVGAGFLHAPELGAAIAVVVWLSALVAALVQARFARWPEPSGISPQPPSAESAQAAGAAVSVLRQAAAAMAEAKRLDGRTFGKALGDSVTAAVYKLMAVGGFMMIGAVIVRLIEPLVPETVPALLLPGLIESHIGAYAATSAQLPGGLVLNAAAAAAVLSWGGISALLQAGGAIAGTDLSLPKLAAARLIQSALAFALTLAAWRPLSGALSALSPAAAPALGVPGAAPPPAAPVVTAAGLRSLWPYAPLLLAGFAAALLLLTFVSISLSNRRSSQT
jgi:sporulation integral membrane protein YlbJ